MRLATAPEGVLGDREQWEKAENTLKDALTSAGLSYTTDTGGGAFYAPKIDIAVTDSLGREHQCATIQLDYQLPRAFKLQYDDAENTKQHPVMIHRAILGSLERFVAILTEHTAGKWPLWMSPRQAIVCTVADRHLPQATDVVNLLRSNDFYVDLDASAERIPRKIRDAQALQYNYMIVIGDREVEQKRIAVRARDGTQQIYSAQEFLQKFQRETAEFK